MNSVETIIRDHKKVMILNYDKLSESETFLKNLRKNGDHTPVIVLSDRGEEIPASILSNCCGGQIFRDDQEKLKELIESMFERNHDQDC